MPRRPQHGYAGRSRVLEAVARHVREVNQSTATIRAMLFVTRQVCMNPDRAAAMPAHQDMRRQREEDVRAADATDGPVAIGPGRRNCRALP